ncbi:MAG: pentapeptide repeat-containing protein [Blautia sp.]|nr:pentapeptide repeat-containing protein [Blautia sp.]
MNQEELLHIVQKHQLWVEDQGGEKAVLANEDLSGLSLAEAYLWMADLSGANLVGADLRKANLREASLQNADLRKADLREADLRRADLRGADLSGAVLTNALLQDADLDQVLSNDLTVGLRNWCPTEGSFTAYKRCGQYIAELLIPADALRSNGTTRRCRTNKAKVISITELNGASDGTTQVISTADDDLLLKEGEEISVSNFDPCRWNEHTTGIYFFMDRPDCIDYPESRPMNCPAKTEVTGYLQVGDKMVTLTIEKDTDRVSGETIKCRCKEAVVRSITEADGGETDVSSVTDEAGIYTFVSGRKVFASHYSKDRWNENGGGIPFFLDKDDAARFPI